MKLYAKEKTAISVINNDELYFIIPDPPNKEKIFAPIPLESLLKDEGDLDDPELIPEEIMARDHVLMIVPDYWVGNEVFEFQSKKRSLVESFLERKLRAEYPGRPDINNFFSYSFYQAESNTRKLYAYFLQELIFFQLYNQLKKRNLCPSQITTSAFLWQEKLKEKISDFNQGGKAFAYILGEKCYLYFFFEGNSLFSRNITFPGSLGDSGDIFGNLIYEIMTDEIKQSLQLFSQKTRLGLNQIHLLSFDPLDAGELSEDLRWEIIELSSMGEILSKESATDGHLGAMGGLRLDNVAFSDESFRLSHKGKQNEQKWKLVQTTGLVLGILLLFIFLGEGVLLWKWSRPSALQLAEKESLHETDPTQTLQQYNQMLAFNLEESQRQSMSDGIVNMTRSFPGNVWIKSMVIEAEPDPSVQIAAIVKAAGPKQFKETLSLFLDNLNKYFEGSRVLGINDIDFDINSCTTEVGDQDCVIMLGFNLP